MIELPPVCETQDYLSSQIITYLGNKRTLLPFIEKAVDFVRHDLGKEKLISADIFSGSGVVSRLLKGYSSYLLANDIEGYAKTINMCYLSNSSQRDMAALSAVYKSLCGDIEKNMAPGFITRLYSPKDQKDISADERVFYTPENANYIDTARRLIEEINEDIRHFFLAPLIYEASVKTNTSGVFKGFYKNSKTGRGQFGGNGKNALTRILAPIKLPFPVFSNYDCTVEIAKERAEALAPSLSGFDLVYIDPPYNQHPYGSNYFMLNLINDYVEPESLSRVSGIPRGWTRSAFNSKATALASLKDICVNADTKYLLLSFNSEGFVSRFEMENMLASLGQLTVFEHKYNTFRGSRNLRNRDIHTKEYLFLLKKG